MTDKNKMTVLTPRRFFGFQWGEAETREPSLLGEILPPFSVLPMGMRMFFLSDFSFHYQATLGTM